MYIFSFSKKHTKIKKLKKFLFLSRDLLKPKQRKRKRKQLQQQCLLK